jgi:hypothetical protein
VADLRIAHIRPALADQPHRELARPRDLARPALSLQSLDGNVRDLGGELQHAVDARQPVADRLGLGKFGIGFPPSFGLDVGSDYFFAALVDPGADFRRLQIDAVRL